MNPWWLLVAGWVARLMYASSRFGDSLLCQTLTKRRTSGEERWRLVLTELG